MSLLLEDRLSELESRMATHIGVDWGGAGGDTYPHPQIRNFFREIHGPTRTSVNSSFPMTFIVDFDDIISKLYQAKLILTISKVRSNVSAATGNSGGASTSGAGSSHSHSVSGQSAAASGDTGSISIRDFAISGGGTLVTTSGGTGNTGSGGTGSTGTESANHQHNETGTTTGVETVTHSHTGPSHTHTGPSHTHTIQSSSSTLNEWSEPSHTHSVSSTTSAADTTHTHSTPNHTHTVTLTYGIFEGPTATDPDLTITINSVDVTSALGGPFNADTELDITSYLRTEDMEPIRDQNTIVVEGDELCDITLTVKSVCEAASEAFYALLP